MILTNEIAVSDTSLLASKTLRVCLLLDKHADPIIIRFALALVLELADRHG